MFANVFKGDPLGNKNSAGKHSTAAQTAAAATTRANSSGLSNDHEEAFRAHRKASAAAKANGDMVNASLHSKSAIHHYGKSKKSEVKNKIDWIGIA